MRKNIFTKIAAVAAATVLAVTALPALVSDTHAADDEYSYVYAGLTWQEYWANEGVYNAGDVTTSNEKDTKGEYDKGAFDTEQELQLTMVFTEEATSAWQQLIQKMVRSMSLPAGLVMQRIR